MINQENVNFINQLRGKKLDLDSLIKVFGEDFISKLINNAASHYKELLDKGDATYERVKEVIDTFIVWELYRKLNIMIDDRVIASDISISTLKENNRRIIFNMAECIVKNGFDMESLSFNWVDRKLIDELETMLYTGFSGALDIEDEKAGAGNFQSKVKNILDIDGSKRLELSNMRGLPILPEERMSSLDLKRMQEQYLKIASEYENEKLSLLKKVVESCPSRKEHAEEMINDINATKKGFINTINWVFGVLIKTAEKDEQERANRLEGKSEVLEGPSIDD